MVPGTAKVSIWTVVTTRPTDRPDSKAIASNEPGLSSGLAVITSILDQLAETGIPAERTILLGFSQGACLALEYAARHARRYGGLVGLSGDLIGPDGTPRDYPGSTPRYTSFSGKQ